MTRWPLLAAATICCPLSASGFTAKYVSGYGDYCANLNNVSYTYVAIQ